MKTQLTHYWILNTKYWIFLQTYVESDEESRVSEGELHLALSEHNLSNNTQLNNSAMSDNADQSQLNSRQIKGTLYSFINHYDVLLHKTKYYVTLHVIPGAPS